MPRVPLPPPVAGRPFSTSHARQLGLGTGRLKGPDLATPHHGVRIPAAQSVLDVRSRARALAPLLRDGWCFTHLTAVSLWGLPLALSRSGGAVSALHVGVVGGRAPRRPGVVGHDLAPGVDIRSVDGLPVVSPLTAWCQSAALLALDDLVAVGDALAGTWSEHPEAARRPMEALTEAVRSRAGTRGAARLREALGLVRPGVESPKETELRILLHRAGLPEPEINTKRYDVRGRYLGKPDLSWPDRLVSLEYEGDEHRRDPRRWRSDIARAERFADAGWRMVRATHDDLRGRGAARLLTRLQTLLDP